jgi:hypothetical protein
MHWPGASMIWFFTLGLFSFVFIPLYFFNGIKNEANKVNTITTTLILIILAGVFFLQTSLKSSAQVYIAKTYNYLQNEELITRMQLIKNDSLALSPELITLSKDINDNCNKIKGMIINDGIGKNSIPKDFETIPLVFIESGLSDEFNSEREGLALVIKLRDQINLYNELVNKSKNLLPIENEIARMLNMKLLQQSNYNLLSAITQIQLFILENEKIKNSR